MGWLVLAWCGLMLAMAISTSSPAGAAIHITVALLTFPLLWKALRERDIETRPKARWALALLLGFIGMLVNGNAYEQTPEGRKAAAERFAARENERQAAELAQERVEAQEALQLASGDHCFSGWDGSLRGLKETVTRNLRNPDSFDHDTTVHSPPNSEGKIGVIMKYRAQNGFGGMNVEVIGVEVDPTTCNFREVDEDKIVAMFPK